MSAIFSECGLYRYRLERRVTASDRIILFIMLNPSTADAERDDPTIRRCIGFGRAMGCGRLTVVNIFAFRATKPADMKAAQDPIGPENDRHIEVAANETTKSGGHILCAWGAHGSYRDRGSSVINTLLLGGHDPHSLGETASNMPRHPLYLRGDCKPLPYRGQT